MSELRIVAIHVEESEPRQFVWVLTERSGQRWDEIARADVTRGRYQHAMADGLVSLQAMVEDLDAGPRTQGTPAVRDRSNRHRAPSSSEQTAAGVTNRAFFGFGPAR